MINTLLQNKLRKSQILIILTQQLQIKSEHYWIIDVKHNKRFGPYNEKQFHEQKDAFKIKVPFQSVDSYIEEQKNSPHNSLSADCFSCIYLKQLTQKVRC